MKTIETFDVSEMKSRLTIAFKAMRKAGLLARQNYECCQSCAGYAMATHAEELITSGKKQKEDIKGCCFYHAQDNDSLIKGNLFYLAYGELGSQKFDKIGLSTEEVGKIVIKCLNEAGIKTDWDGNSNSRIAVVDICK